MGIIGLLGSEESVGAGMVPVPDPVPMSKPRPGPESAFPKGPQALTKPYKARSWQVPKIDRVSFPLCIAAPSGICKAAPILPRDCRD